MDRPEVHTQNGALRGTDVGGVLRFAGIPFAAPPVGPLRWAPPQPPAGWKGVREAADFGGVAIQTIDTGLVGLRGTAQEDCLYLNVWSTTVDRNARQPVMVWIHGGGFLNGSGSAQEYDGAALAKRSVTVVTVNYRLGIFGYAVHPEIGANAGLLDQVAALEWVAGNIAGFGGDPGKVTIFGQSAGGASVRALLATPTARGLFHRAVIQSAGFEDYAVVDSPSYDRSARATARVFDQLGAGDLTALREVPVEAVRNASLAVSGIFAPPDQVHTPANLTWYPVADGQTLVEDDFPAWDPDIPVLLGWTAQEAQFFLRPDRIYGPPGIDPAQVYTSNTLTRMSKILGGPGADAILEHYRDSSFYQAITDLVTETIWKEPAFATLQRFTKLGRRVFAYEFTRISPGARANGIGAFHTAEFPYLFGSPLPPPGFDEADVRTGELMQTAWVSFADTGVPVREAGAAWAPYDLHHGSIYRISDTIEDGELTLSPVSRSLQAARAPLR